MAKSKTDAKVGEIPILEVSVPADPVSINGPEGPIVVEKIDDKPVIVKAFKFELVGGPHFVGERAYYRGDFIESDDDLVAEFGTNKFRRVE